MTGDGDIRSIILSDLKKIDDGAEVLAIAPLSEGYHNPIFHLETTRGDLFLKWFQDRPTDADVQFQAIRTLQNRSPDVPVVRPVYANADLGTYYAEWFSGSSLDRYVTSLGCRNSSLELHIGQAGEWLGKLHKEAPAEIRPLESLSKLTKLDRQLEHGNPVSSPLVANVREFLRKTGQEFEEQLTLWSCRHGDYKPGNLMLGSNGQLYGIDMMLIHIAPVYYDVASFLINMRYQLYRNPNPSIFFSYEQMQQTFVSGYQTSIGQKINRAHLNWVLLYSALWMTLRDMQSANARISAVKNVIRLFLLSRFFKEAQELT